MSRLTGSKQQADDICQFYLKNRPKPPFPVSFFPLPFFSFVHSASEMVKAHRTYSVDAKKHDETADKEN